MAERLTGFDYCFTRCMEPGADKQEIREDCSLYKVCLERQIFEKLQRYEDLEEQGRLIILPDGMNLRKLLDILDGYSSSCPSEYNLINRCELSCFECWLAALKGAENDTRTND